VPESSRRIAPRALSADAWEPFGWLPVNDTDPLDGMQTLSFEWSDPHVNAISHARSEVPAVPGGLRCERMFRHLTHTQVLMALDNACVIAVAAPGSVLDRIEEAKMVTAFVLEPLQAIVLHRGTWHWGPFPTAAAEVRLFNVQGRRYSEDNQSFDLVGQMAVDILTG
jgi:ureidoglycolate hydrolase